MLRYHDGAHPMAINDPYLRREYGMAESVALRSQEKKQKSSLPQPCP